MEKNRKLLLQQLKENRKYIVVLMMMSFVISIFSLTVPWFMQYFTDNIIVTGTWEKAYLVIAAFLGITVVRLAVDMLYEKVLAYVTYKKVAFELRKRVEKILIYLDCKYIYKKSHKFEEDDIESILLGDVDAFRSVLSQTIKFLTEILKLIVYIALLFYYSIPVGVLVCARIPIYYLLSHFFNKPLSKRNEANRSLQSVLIQRVKKIFISLPAIKTLGEEGEVFEELNKKVKEHCANQKKSSLINAGYQEINTAVNTIMNMLVLVLCGYAVLNSKMTIGK